MMTIKKLAPLFILSVVIFSVKAAALEPHVFRKGSGGQGSFDQVLSNEFSLYYLPAEEGAPLMSYITQNEPPLMKGFSVDPGNPGPGDDITITANIYNDPLMTRSRTIEVVLHYSTDGKKTWETRDMAETVEGREWKVTLPAAGEATTLYFYFVAMDDAENYYMEVPELDVAWASGESESFHNTIKDRNDVYTLVADDLDILSVSLGFDGDLIYLGMEVEGEISGGTVTPFEINVYSAGFYIPTERMDIGPKPRYVLEHSQHAQFITFPVIGLLDVEKSLAEIRTADARYYSRRNHLAMRMDKSVIDQYDAQYIRICFGSALGLQALPLVVDPRDVSSFINVVFGEHWIDIE